MVAARIGLAESLSGGASTTAEIAGRCDVHREPLELTLRALASVGFCREVEAGKWTLGPLGEHARGTAPGGAREALLAMESPWHWANWSLWSRLEQTLRSGRPAYDAQHGPLFEEMDHDRALRESFHAFMHDRSLFTVPAILDALDVAPGSRLVDVGGGRGALIEQLLERHPSASGVLFDRASVIADCAGLQRLGGRLSVEGGDFRSSVPEDADLYLIKEVLHNWGDDDALAILDACRRSMRPGARVVVCESPLASTGRASLVSVGMYLVFGGRQRSVREFESLFERAGLTLIEARPTSHATLHLMIGQASS
jgi:hypothetical protein